MTSHKAKNYTVPATLPYMPLIDTVLFPGEELVVEVNTEESAKLINMVYNSNVPLVAFFTQKDSNKVFVSAEDLFQIGTVGEIKDVYKKTNGAYEVSIQGIVRVQMRKTIEAKYYPVACLAVLADTKPKQDFNIFSASLRNFIEQIKYITGVDANITPLYEQFINLDPRDLAAVTVAVDEAAAVLLDNKEIRQMILEATNVYDRITGLIAATNKEIRMIELSKKVQANIQQEMTEAEKKFVIRKQIEGLKRMLGDSDNNDLADLQKRVEESGMTEEAKKEADRELNKLSKTPMGSQDYTLSLTYVEWLLSLPWNKSTQDDLNITKAKAVLDEDHFGLKEIKERIIEFLAIRQLNPKSKGSILCFIGPPGTGKTSLGKSIARALGRKFIRQSLGGVHDEAEIRGHRRTYVGALPGKIISEIRRNESNNPLFMLDEIDKVGTSSIHGDPSSALLEVLDPEQNNTFVDNYLGVPFDLSKVMFITTGNDVNTIPQALRDRMEIIELVGYTREEKKQIAFKYLVNRQMVENGITVENIKFTDDGIFTIIDHYVVESGVRSLERRIGKICRKVATRVASGQTDCVVVDGSKVVELLGPFKIRRDQTEQKDKVGVTTGLAWTMYGGVLLFMEAVKTTGAGRLVVTGRLGEVMRESAQIAMTCVHSLAEELSIPEELFTKYDVHIHAPEGATPKDGPSAGITLATTLASLLSGRKVRGDIAMTGELTLTGNVLPIGGLIEKTLAAYGAGIRTVIAPVENKEDLLYKLAPEIQKEMNFVFVSNIREVLKLALREKDSNTSV